MDMELCNLDINIIERTHSCKLFINFLYKRATPEEQPLALMKTKTLFPVNYHFLIQLSTITLIH
jgi:hypothetical protein